MRRAAAHQCVERPRINASSGGASLRRAAAHQCVERRRIS